MNRFDAFTDLERELIRYGLRNCSIYGPDTDKEMAAVYGMLEELTGSSIPFIEDHIRALMDEQKQSHQKQ